MENVYEKYSLHALVMDCMIVRNYQEGSVQVNKYIDMYEAQQRMLEYGIHFNQLIQRAGRNRIVINCIAGYDTAFSCEDESFPYQTNAIKLGYS